MIETAYPSESVMREQIATFRSEQNNTTLAAEMASLYILTGTVLQTEYLMAMLRIKSSQPVSVAA
jgi:hypothetical protein